MFSGDWIEKSSDEVYLEFSDSNITAKSLDIVFGSFYHDSFQLKDKNIVAVLATSVWFQLDDLCISCEEFILKILNLKNVVQFYDIAILYNMPTLIIKCIEFISKTILLVDDCEEFNSILRSISLNLMLEIIKNPRLFVIQIEQDVFHLLLKWLYLKLHQKFDSSIKDLNVFVHNYFKTENINLNCIPELFNINKLLEVIRWEQVISTYNAASSLSKFSIIPQDILISAYRNQWLSMLKSHEFKPPTNQPLMLDVDFFWNKSERCGRKLLSDISTTWRWNTYKYGIDIVIRYINREFYLIRYIDRKNCPDWMKHVPKKRTLQLHLSIATYYLEKFNENAFYPIFTNQIESDVITLELTENIPVKVLTIPLHFEFPLILSANFLRYDLYEINNANDSLTIQSNHSFDDYTNQMYLE